MMMRSVRHLFLLSTALSVIAAPALAEDKIIVTGTKLNSPIESIPGSVSVLDTEDVGGLSPLGAAEELTERLAGVEAAVANGTQIAFQIRGIGAVDHQALTPGAAAIYTDGVFLATNVQTGFLLYDIDRVEVLKGPQGTLYGRNASSGAVNFQTVRPSTNQTSYLRVSAGSDQLIDVQTALGTSFADNLHGRLAGRVFRQNAVLDNVVTNENVSAPRDGAGEREEYGLRASLLWERDNGMEILFRSHGELDKGINPSPQNSGLGLGDHEISVGPDGIQDTDSAFWGLSTELTATLAEWDIVSLSAYEGYDQNYGFDFGAVPALFGDPDNNALLAYERDFAQWSQEVRGQRMIGDHRIMIGASASLDDFEQDYLIWCGELDRDTLVSSCTYIGAPGRVGPTPVTDGEVRSLLTHIEQTRETAALFTHNDFALNELTTLTLGGRITYERIESEGFGVHIFDDGVAGLNNRGGLGGAEGSNVIEDTRFTGNVALSRQFGAGTAYLAVSSGYKSGGFNGEVQNNALHFADEGLFEAETVIAYEAGLKTSLGSDTSFNAAVFYQDYQDPQARIFVNFPLPNNTAIISNSLSNLDEAISYGAEANLDWAVSPALDLRAGLVWLETEIRQGTEDVPTGNADTFDGNALPFAPEFSATLSARYTHDCDHGGKLVLDAHAKYRSDFYLDAEGLEDRKQEGYGLVDSRVTYHPPQSPLTVSLWGRNLLDKDYAVSGYGFVGYNTFRGAPRSWGVEAGIRF